jgi:hypothetical protein
MESKSLQELGIHISDFVYTLLSTDNNELHIYFLTQQSSVDPKTICTEAQLHEWERQQFQVKLLDERWRYGSSYDMPVYRQTTPETTKQAEFRGGNIFKQSYAPVLGRRFMALRLKKDDKSDNKLNIRSAFLFKTADVPSEDSDNEYRYMILAERDVDMEDAVQFVKTTNTNLHWDSGRIAFPRTMKFRKQRDGWEWKTETMDSEVAVRKLLETDTFREDHGMEDQCERMWHGLERLKSTLDYKNKRKRVETEPLVQ